MKRKILIAMILMTAGISALKFNDTTKVPDDWRLILVNDENSIPSGYEPELMQLSDGVRIDARIYPDLQKMFDDTRQNRRFQSRGIFQT